MDGDAVGGKMILRNALTLTDEHLAVINTAVQEMPLRLAYPVIAEINRQIAAQDEQDLPDDGPT